MAPWRKTFYAAWIAQFLAIMGFTFVWPFMPFFIQSLGIESDAESAWWTGLCTGISAATLFIFSPIWGALADRYGRKPMVLRAMFCAALVLAAMGFVQNVGQLLVLRALQGAVTGTVTATTALVASVAPRDRSGHTMGMLQGAMFVGGAVGPMVGGLITEFISYRVAFLAAGGALALGGFLVQFAVTEQFTPMRERHRTERGTFGQVFRTSGFVIILLSVFSLRFANHIVYPVVPGLVKEIWGSEHGLRLLTGCVYGVAGITVALTAGHLGRLSDRLGHKRMLSIFVLAGGIASFLHVPAHSIGVLLAVRVLFGVSAAGMLASANALIRDRVHDHNVGKAYGVTSSIGALGWGLGPLVGGYLAWTTGSLRVPFGAAGITFLIGAVLVMCFVPGLAPDPAETRQPKPETD